MTTNESWIYQGRQGHGYFGNGTAPKDDEDSSDDAGPNHLFYPANAGQRVDYVASSLIAHVPRSDRSRWNSAVSDASRTNLKTAVAAWYGARSLSRDAFRTQFLDPYTSDDTVDHLRSAAKGMIEGQNHDDLAKAGDDLAAAAQKIGPDTWPRFLGNASHQAIDAVSRGDVPGVVKVGAMDQPVGVFFAFLGLLALFFGWPGSEISKTTPVPARPASPTIMQQDRPEEVPPPGGQTGSAVDSGSSSPGPAVVSDDRRKHILDGDITGGGHRPGRNLPGKSEFPPGWSDDRIIGDIESVANDPASSRRPGKNKNRTISSGTRDGVDIDVIIEGDGKTIVSGFPTNTGRNPKETK